MLTDEEIKEILAKTKPIKASLEAMMHTLYEDNRIKDFLVAEEDEGYGCYFKIGDEDHQFTYFSVPYIK